MNRPLYIVLHIYKTAGKTLFSNFQRNLKSDQLLAMYAPQIGLDKAECSANPGWNETAVLAYLHAHYTAKTQCIFGHMAFYGIHELDLVADRDVRYIVFLREPVARIVSLYNFLRCNSKNAWHQEIVANNWSLAEWFANSRGLWLHDGQIRQLVLWQRKDVLEHRQLDAGHLALAHKALEQMWFIGCQEHFRADTERLYKALHFKAHNFEARVNVSHGDVTPDPATANAIAVDNAFDIELYRYALALREQSLAMPADAGSDDRPWRQRLAGILPFRSLSA